WPVCHPCRARGDRGVSGLDEPAPRADARPPARDEARGAGDRCGDPAAPSAPQRNPDRALDGARRADLGRHETTDRGGVHGIRAAGWSLAAPVTLHPLWRVYSAGLRNRPYPTAPVTPAFLGGRPQDLAFEKAVIAGSIRQRHHIRIWSSGFTLADGSPIWLATA